MPKKVLIADDTEFFRTALKDILTGGGYEVVGEAANGAEALWRAHLEVARPWHTVTELLTVDELLG